MFKIQLVRHAENEHGSEDVIPLPEEYESDYEIDGSDLLHSTEGFYGMENLAERPEFASDPFDWIAGGLWRSHAGSMGVVELSEGLYIQPLASPYMEVPAAPHVIYIDPFSAFGDGRHPSTALCLRFLSEYIGPMPLEVRSGLSVFDAGAGSGILSIAAEKLGAGLIDAVELNAAAVRAAHRNLELNFCERTDLRQGDILSAAFNRAYDIVLSNLVSDVVISCLNVLVRLVKQEGVMIVSGITAVRSAEVEERFFAAGMSIADSALLDGWVGYLLKCRQSS